MSIKLTEASARRGSKGDEEKDPSAIANPREHEETLCRSQRQKRSSFVQRETSGAQSTRKKNEMKKVWFVGPRQQDRCFSRGESCSQCHELRETTREAHHFSLDLEEPSADWTQHQEELARHKASQGLYNIKGDQKDVHSLNFFKGNSPRETANASASISINKSKEQDVHVR